MPRLVAADGGKSEAKLQRETVAYLRRRGWFAVVLVGSAYQTGVPDLWVHHPQFGSRWIDLKRPGRYSFTRAQRTKWPIWDANGVGIWILTGAGQSEYDKLFAAPNWRDYWKESWGSPTPFIDELRDEYVRECCAG